MPKRPARRQVSSITSVTAIRRKNASVRTQKHSRKATILTWAASAALVMAVILTVGVIGAFAYFSRDLPSPTKLTNREVAQSSKIYDRNGELLYDIYDGEHDRTLVELKDIPQNVIDATIAAEDPEFYEHQGFDIRGITRAVYQNLFSQSIQSGGSTITQQLVKLAILEDTRQVFTRKLKELILALQIERRYTKDEILQIYLNEIPYGGTAYGVESASRHYFGKSVKDLSLAESSLLSGLPQSPTQYNPLVNPDAAIERQKYVLRQMVSRGKISQAEADEALAQKLTFVSGVDRSNIKAPHFVMYVRQLLEDQYGAKLVEQGGLRITTTLDYGKQKIAEEEVTKQIEVLAKSKANATNAGLIAVNPNDGQIISYVGSANFNNADNDGNVDVIQRDRQPGSAIKPITYLTGITKGYGLGTYVSDIKTCFGEYCPKNSDDKFWGPVLPREGLSNSRNIPALKMLALVGNTAMLDMAHKLGITTMNDPKAYGLSLGLGSAEAKPYDMAQVYATLANEGVQQTLTSILKVEDANGKVLDQYHQSEGKKVVDAGAVYLITNVLSDNNARTRLFGRGNKLEIGRPAAVKTGTTDDNKDAWTVGYTPSLSTIVWVGNFNNEAMNGIQGSTGATPIWNGYMKRALDGTEKENFNKPSNVVEVKIDAISGMLPGPHTTSTRTEMFLKGAEPTQMDTFAKSVKVDKSNNLLANAASIATGNAEDRVCVQLKEEVAAWQSFTDEWMKTAGAPWGCPTQTSELYHTAGDVPIVKITSQTDGQDVGKNFTVKADVASGAVITKVTFLLDGVEVKQLSSIPYEYAFSLNNSSLGKRTITVKALDSKGNEGSTSISVTVKNSISQVPANQLAATFPTILAFKS